MLDFEMFGYLDELKEVEVDGITGETTPVEEHSYNGERIWVKRDDLYSIHGARGGKARSCWYLCSREGTSEEGEITPPSDKPVGVVTAGARQSPQIMLVSTMANALGIGCRCHAPSGSLTDELRYAEKMGAELIQHKPGYNSVIVSRAAKDAEELGWKNIPFGMECWEAVQQTALQVENLKGIGFKRLVMPVGSGMSFAGVLWGLSYWGIECEILGVRVGADPKKRLEKYAPGMVGYSLETSALKYHDYVENHFLDAENGEERGLDLDPIYEAKCLPYLKEGDLLWSVGHRNSWEME